MNSGGTAAPSTRPARGTIDEAAALLLKLGLIAFGGPAAHIALTRDGVVERPH
jgi:chromate transporter